MANGFDLTANVNVVLNSTSLQNAARQAQSSFSGVKADIGVSIPALIGFGSLSSLRYRRQLDQVSRACGRTITRCLSTQVPRSRE